MTSPRRLLAPLLAASSALLVSACVKQVEQVAPAPKPAPTSEAFSTAAADNHINTPSVAGIPGAAIAQAQRANARIEVASTNTRDHGAIFKQAKDLLAQKKYAEALGALDTIQPELLTPAQVKAVDELRAEIKTKQTRGQ